MMYGPNTQLPHRMFATVVKQDGFVAVLFKGGQIGVYYHVPSTSTSADVGIRWGGIRKLLTQQPFKQTLGSSKSSIFHPIKKRVRPSREQVIDTRKNVCLFPRFLRPVLGF